MFTPLIQYFMKQFAKMPEYLGPAANFTTKVLDGRLLAEVNGSFVEVVLAGKGELAKLPYDLAEGLYVVGTGSTGAAEALAVMGAGYFVVMLGSALAFKSPHPSYVPAGMPVVSKAAAAAGPDVSVDKAMYAPQLYLLGTTLFCVAAGGMSLFR